MRRRASPLRGMLTPRPYAGMARTGPCSVHGWIGVGIVARIPLVWSSRDAGSRAQDGMEMTASRLPYCRKARPVLGIRLVYRPRPGGMAPRPQAITFVRCDVVWRVCRYGSCLSWCPLSAIPPERPPSAGILVFPTRFPRVPRRYHAATGENHGVAIRPPYGPLSSLSTPFINRYPPSGATAE